MYAIMLWVCIKQMFCFNNVKVPLYNYYNYNFIDCGVVGVVQLQQEEAQKIRDKRANEAALAALSAIGSGTKRKRPQPAEGVS